jgi:hypothetical protein
MNFAIILHPPLSYAKSHPHNFFFSEFVHQIHTWQQLPLTTQTHMSIDVESFWRKHLLFTYNPSRLMINIHTSHYHRYHDQSVATDVEETETWERH